MRHKLTASFRRMFGIAGKIVTFLIALGIIGFAWKHFTKNIYTNFTLKTANGFRADFIELGLGYRLAFDKTLTN